MSDEVVVDGEIELETTTDGETELETVIDGDPNVAIIRSYTVIDSELSETSTNPVQNKVITQALNNTLTMLDISVVGEKLIIKKGE